MSVSENLKECPTCKTSGYVNETYITVSQAEEQKKTFIETIKVLENSKNFYEKEYRRSEFWNNNSWIIGLSLFVIMAIGIAFAISTHTFQPDTIGDKIEDCARYAGKDRCVCMSGYVSELPKEAQADYVVLVNRCYAD